VVVWPSDWSYPRTKATCNHESPYPVAADGNIDRVKPMLDVLRQYGVTSETRVIPTGLEESSFRHGDRDGFRERYGIPQDRPMMLFVGRLAFEKNIHFLLEVLQMVRHTNFKHNS
jgi:glycosyltransferase involved in cell wall biosynthesis